MIVNFWFTKRLFIIMRNLLTACIFLLVFTLNAQVVVQIGDSTVTWFAPKNTPVKSVVDFRVLGADSTYIICYPVTTLSFECGQWESDSTFTIWTNISKDDDPNKVNDKTGWVYRTSTLNSRVPKTNASYCPCGCPADEGWIQMRIDPITGIIQKREIKVVYTYNYEPAPFDKLQSLYKKPASKAGN